MSIENRRPKLDQTEYLDAELSMSSFLVEDKGNPKYEKLLEDVEDIVHRSDAGTLVDLVKSNFFHPTVLLRLFEKYAAEEKVEFRDNFIKLVDALTELEMLNYELSEELTAQNLHRYYSVLKKAELVLKDKEVEAIALMVEEKKLHPSVLERLAKEYEKGRKDPGGSFAKKVGLALDIAVDDEFVN